MSFIKNKTLTFLFVMLIIIGIIAPITMHYNKMTEEEWYFRTHPTEGRFTNPKVKMVYSEIVFPFTLEVGIYPELTDEIEEEIRALGEPYNARWVKYVGTSRSVYPAKENDLGITVPTFF